MKTDFKIYSLLVVKNEADIIRASLIDACRWSDKIIVLDNGSTDGTWEEVLSLSQEQPQIVAFGRYEGAFNIGLRARLFAAYRKEMTSRDWWCVRLDADEFFPGDVKAFLAAIPRCYRTVKKSSTDYLLSEADIPSLTGHFEKDRAVFHLSLAEHRQERRFMRHRRWLIWSEGWRYPHPWGRVAPQTIPVDHYQYRSVEQMQKRWQTRHDAKAAGCNTFKHENPNGWQDYLWENQSKDIETLFNEAPNVLKTGRNELRETAGIVIKSFAIPRGWRRLMYSFFRKSKARRSYEYAMELGELTPAPISYKEVRNGHLLTRSYYACKQSVCPFTFKDLRNPAFPDRERHLKAIGRFAAMLHERGVLHPDFSQGNILFDETDHIEIVDLNRIRHKRHISLRQGLRNLERLRLHDDEAFRILTDAYIKQRKQQK